MSEVEVPFDVETGIYTKEKLTPGFYDHILNKEQLYKEVTPFEIKTSIHNCFACDNTRFVKPLELSNFDASIMVIGEVPSDVDFRTKEGKLLADTLTWAKYDMDDIFFTSLIKCEESSTPERCQHHLLSELLCVQPQLIISLGYEVGKHFDPAINSAGYSSVLLDKYNMLTTYRTTYAMTSSELFEEYCNHMLRAKEKVNSTQQRSS